MNGYLARRIAKLEDRRRTRIRVPHVADIREGETTEAAIARFRARYRDAIPPKHSLLIVPDFGGLDAFAAALKEQQTALHAWVREQHGKEVPC